jgi:hypothetical protein
LHGVTSTYLLRAAAAACPAHLVGMWGTFAAAANGGGVKEKALKGIGKRDS